ncbi:MAG: alpha-ribazole phosphatase family protein [Bacteroidaceae bacterium]|nr:alpha-ribazole phosphatase family protein [Bacteroidaceae bacterium]
MQLYLIRHTSVSVPRGTCYGWTDVPVSNNFEIEAEACRRQLCGLQFDRVYTSPLTRARKLADYCGYPDALMEPRMKEMHMGDWEMQRFDEIKDPQLKEYYENYLDSPTRNGESFQDLYRRVASFIEELKATLSPDASVAVFCHGGPIICAMVYGGLIPLEQGYANIPDYASVTKVEI